jgi:hypothetical protein
MRSLRAAYVWNSAAYAAKCAAYAGRVCSVRCKVFSMRGKLPAYGGNARCLRSEVCCVRYIGRSVGCTVSFLGSEDPNVRWKGSQRRQRATATDVERQNPRFFFEKRGFHWVDGIPLTRGSSTAACSPPAGGPWSSTGSRSRPSRRAFAPTQQQRHGRQERHVRRLGDG